MALDKAETDPSIRLPQKKFYRQRAHSNPMADHSFDYPVSPDQMDWHQYYPKFFPSDEGESKHDDPKDEISSHRPQVEFADIGCGYGGLLVSLSPLFPDTLMLGERMVSNRVAESGFRLLPRTEPLFKGECRQLAFVSQCKCHCSLAAKARERKPKPYIPFQLLEFLA